MEKEGNEKVKVEIMIANECEHDIYYSLHCTAGQQEGKYDWVKVVVRMKHSTHRTAGQVKGKCNGVKDSAKEEKGPR